MKRWNQQGGGGREEDGEERGFVVGRSLEMEREVEERRVSRVRVWEGRRKMSFWERKDCVAEVTEERAVRSWLRCSR